MCNGTDREVSGEFYIFFLNELFEQHHPGGIVREREIDFPFKKGFSLFHVALMRFVGESNEDNPVIFFQVFTLFEVLKRFLKTSGSSTCPLRFLRREDKINIIHEDDSWLELLSNSEGHVQVLKSTTLIHTVAF